MNFLLESSNRYLTGERSERVSCRVEHEKIKFVSTSGHVIFGLLYKHINDVFDDFRRFPTTFRRFSKIVPKERRTSPNIFRTFFRRLPKISEEGPMMHLQTPVQSKYNGICSHSDGDHFSNYGNTNILICER